MLARRPREAACPPVSPARGGDGTSPRGQLSGAISPTIQQTTVQDSHPLRYGVFGGTFNPVHEGHLELIQGVLETGLVEHMVVVPARVSPFKTDAALLPDGLRLEMLRVALAGRSRVTVSDLELRRPPPSYTVDTLAALELLLPRGRAHLVMGMDSFAGFAGWRGAGSILERAALLLVVRHGEAAPPAEGEAAPSAEGEAALRQGLPESWGGRLRAEGPDRLVDEGGRAVITRLSLRVRAVSSTRIREAGALGDVPAPARELLEPYLATAADGEAGWSAGT